MEPPSETSSHPSPCTMSIPILSFDLNSSPTVDLAFDLNDIPEDSEHEGDINLHSDVSEPVEHAQESDHEVDDTLSLSNEAYWRKLEFATIVNCHDFYKDYAKEHGFEVRRQYATIGRKSGIREYVLITCNKTGFKDDSPHNPINQSLNSDQICNLMTEQKKAKSKGKSKQNLNQDSSDKKFEKAEIRTGCEAHMYFRWCHKRKVYCIGRWSGVHNHELHNKEDAFMLKTNREITPAQAIFAETAQRAGLKLRSSYELMCIQAGGRDSLGFLKQDLKNHLNRRRQKDMRRGEGTKLMEHFRERAFTSPLFYYDVEVDQDERIANIFWADECMRMDYASFGDVVTFDTTFRTNKAYRPLAVFIGFNHHRETCVFGAALLFDETAESFKWLFKTFLRCMGEKHPLTLFTDQDAAMAVAIPHQLPTTYHGLCTWHLMQNGAKNLGAKFTKTFSHNLKRLMYDVESEDEFQSLFDETNAMVSNNSGSDAHWWMKRIYVKRRQWSWAWMRYQFTAGIRSTQLVESFNATIKDFLQSDYHIDDFFSHFERMLENTRMRERQSDFDAIEKLRRNEFPSSPILKHAARVYTEKIFNLLQKQYINMLSYRAIPLSNDISCPSQQFKVYQSLSGQQVDQRDVFVDTKELELRCSCLMFENFGILCCHILRVMDVVGSTICDSLLTIPEKYVLKRWTVKAKMGTHYSPMTNLSGNGIASDPRHVMIMKLLKLAGQACSRVDFHEKIAPEIDRVCKLMDDLIDSANDHASITTDAENAPSTSNGPVLMVKENTIKSRRRLKSAVELMRKDTAKRGRAINDIEFSVIFVDSRFFSIFVLYMDLFMN